MSNSNTTANNKVITKKIEAEYKAWHDELPANKAISLTKLRASRVEKNYLEDTLLIAFFKEFNGMVFQQKDTSEYFKVCGFVGASKNPDFQYFFSTEKELSNFIEMWSENEKHKAAFKRMTGSAHYVLKDLVTLGDVFMASWGCEQTNLNYYQVVGIRGKSTLELKEIDSKIVSGNNDRMGGMKVPVKNTFKDSDVFSRRVLVVNKSDGKKQVSVQVQEDSINAFLKPVNDDGSYTEDYYSSYA